WSADDPRTLNDEVTSELDTTPGSVATARRGSGSARLGISLSSCRVSSCTVTPASSRNASRRTAPRSTLSGRIRTASGTRTTSTLVRFPGATSTVLAAVAWPRLETTRTYCPGGTGPSWNRPSSSVTPFSRSGPSGTLSTTNAAGTGRPSALRTWPCTFGCSCASALRGAATAASDHATSATVRGQTRQGPILVVIPSRPRSEVRCSCGRTPVTPDGSGRLAPRPRGRWRQRCRGPVRGTRKTVTRHERPRRTTHPGLYWSGTAGVGSSFLGDPGRDPRFL